LLIIVISTLVGCAPAATPTAAPELTVVPTRIVLVMKTLTNPFFIQMERAAPEFTIQFAVL